MKVKVGELKTHLSKYLRNLEGSDEAIEVCVREETVAFLRSAKAEDGLNAESAKLDRRLEAAGLTVSQWGTPAEPLRSPGRCEDPAGGANSVETIRRQRNY
jgi:antitoxin (DNA-binding transcriptional repressor) of toxin-antitoxin stability system